MIGAIISHYRILGVQGSGGMATVYGAGDLRLGRGVALKFLPAERSGNPRALARFRQGARTDSSLDHPNICMIYDVDEYQGRPFISMELLEGKTLELSLAGSTLDVPRLLETALQIADGLDAASAKRVAHRNCGAR